MPVRDCPRVRPELVWSRFVSEGRDSWIVKDPVVNEYMRFDALTGELAHLFDGTRTADDVLDCARERWPGLEFDEDYIADLIQYLRSLKYLEDPFQRRVLLEARAKEERMRITAKSLSNIFQFPLGYVDPNRFLTRTYPAVRFLFRPAMVYLGMVLFTFSGYVVWINREHIATSASNLALGEGHRLLGALLIWIVITVAIIIHELGHGYAVKHHGGNVSRIGFLFLFGIPCMFCDTSDTHLMSNWKHRAHVALAGTYTELYVASIATLVWWITPSDLVINQLAYNVILFASVSGILFNYNPLIKMDGYYLLSDVLGMPNLLEDSYEYLGYLFRRHVLRMKAQTRAHGRSRKRVLLLFGATSIAYSVFFATLMYVFLRRLLVDRLALVGVVLSVGLALMVLRRPLKPIVRTTRLWWLESGSRLGGPRQRRLAALLAAAALVPLLFLLPVPGRRTVPVTLEPARSMALLAPEEMRLRWAGFHAGQAVAAGQLLALLDTDSAAVMRDEARARAGVLRVAAATALEQGERAAAVLQRTRAAGEEAGSAWISRRIARAELRAPFAGRVLTASAPWRAGERVEPGDTICVLGDFSRLRAVALVPEADLDDFRLGEPVRVRLRAWPGLALRGAVQTIEASAGKAGRARAYRVWLALAPPPGSAASDLRAGLTGRGHLVTPARPLVAHLLRWLARYLRVDLWV